MKPLAIVRIVLLAALLLTVSTAAPLLAAGDESLSPVFLVVGYGDPTPDGRVQVVPYGNGFLVAPDGSALAPGYATVERGGSLGAIVNGELFGLAVVCTTKVDPHLILSPEESVAHVNIVPLAAPIRTAVFYGLEGLEVARGHQGPMPTFPRLMLADSSPAEGDLVTIRAAQFTGIVGGEHIGPVPNEEMTMERVEKVLEPYHIFGMQSTSAQQAHYSGSPVLNARGQVVGMSILGLTPDFRISGNWGALGVEVLKGPCP